MQSDFGKSVATIETELRDELLRLYAQNPKALKTDLESANIPYLTTELSFYVAPNQVVSSFINVLRGLTPQVLLAVFKTLQQHHPSSSIFQSSIERIKVVMAENDQAQATDTLISNASEKNKPHVTNTKSSILSSEEVRKIQIALGLHTKHIDNLQNISCSEFSCSELWYSLYLWAEFVRLLESVDESIRVLLGLQRLREALVNIYETMYSSEVELDLTQRNIYSVETHFLREVIEELFNTLPIREGHRIIADNKRQLFLFLQHRCKSYPHEKVATFVNRLVDLQERLEITTTDKLTIQKQDLVFSVQELLHDVGPLLISLEYTLLQLGSSSKRIREVLSQNGHRSLSELFRSASQSLPHLSEAGISIWEESHV